MRLVPVLAVVLALVAANASAGVESILIVASCNGVAQKAICEVSTERGHWGVDATPEWLSVDTGGTLRVTCKQAGKSVMADVKVLGVLPVLKFDLCTPDHSVGNRAILKVVGESSLLPKARN